VGWVCGAAFAYHFVLQPLAIFGLAAYGMEVPPLPNFDMGQLMTVLMGMLGLGGLRSFEKYKHVAK
jgi:Sec-independent protein secretion pathway component TatC